MCDFCDLYNKVRRHDNLFGILFIKQIYHNNNVPRYNDYNSVYLTAKPKNAWNSPNYNIKYQVYLRLYYLVL